MVKASARQDRQQAVPLVLTHAGGRDNALEAYKLNLSS
jgi:hypothetical protein